MGTTIEDILYEQAEEENNRQEEIVRATSANIDLIVLASEINNFLPKDPSTLINYIKHLWDAFVVVVERGGLAEGFAILPFHLLFMFSIQYKVFRISAYNRKEYINILRGCNIRDLGARKVLENNPPLPDSTGDIPSSSSVRNLSLLPEKKLFDFLKIVKVSNKLIVNAQNLVDIRSTYAHANGNIEENLEDRIEEYLEILRSIQPHLLNLNNSVAEKWKTEMESEESVAEYVELHLAEEFLCPADMQQGKLGKIDKKLNERK